MAVIPRLIARYAILLYVFCAAGTLLYLRAALNARRKRGLALFAMERDAATTQSLRSWSMVAVCLLLAIGVYSVRTYVAPNLPPEQKENTPVAGLLFTPTALPTLSPTPASTASPTATSGPVPTVAPIVTPPPRVPDTPVPTTTPEGSGGPIEAACSSAGTQIISPKNGDRVSGVIEVLGTANLPEFSFYKFEIQWPNTEQWVTVQSFEAPVVGGLLGTWDTTPLTGQPGTYRFRLVVVDKTGNYPEPCVISVVIE
jgi:hypothetical protein